jgi:hypothetical protein
MQKHLFLLIGFNKNLVEKLCDDGAGSAKIKRIAKIVSERQNKRRRNG